MAVMGKYGQAGARAPILVSRTWVRLLPVLLPIAKLTAGATSSNFKGE